ncbi:type II toxin-antitoxin system YafQ family toxin [Bartonella sp. DGB2]|uniref:type II toxin-antitoxin system RelE/ParE family toxin n=1 Tax=Bartonella sp. DGB2 TaxID=3388426 RepID=UPI00399029D1
MLALRLSKTFKQDVRKAEKRGKDMAKLRVLLDLLVNEMPLPKVYQDHPLRGTWAGFRDAHIEPDWIIIYRVKGSELQLARTGTHSDLF